jgi:uncharacterized protein YfaP (DUF2135 family)
VDLDVFEPSGSHVSYAFRSGTSGSLDVANTTANGPEHDSASCDLVVLRTGDYVIGITNCAGASGRTATVQGGTVRRGILLTRTLDVGAARGWSRCRWPVPMAAGTATSETDGSHTATAR